MTSTTRRNAPIAALATAFLLAAAFALPARSVLAGDPPPPGGGKPDVPPANPPMNPPVAPPAVPPPVPPPAALPKLTIDEARQELNHLTDFLKNRKADTQDILGALEAVMKAYPNLKPNMVKDPATGAESEDTAHFDEQKNFLQKDVEKALMKALDLDSV